jgi:PAS domain S-box-containing protein
VSHAAQRAGDEAASVGAAEVAALRLLARVAVLANEAPAVGPCLTGALREVCEHAGWDVGHAWLLADDGTGALVSSGHWYLADAERFEPFCAATAALRLPAGSGFPGRVLARGAAEAGSVRGDGTDGYEDWVPPRVEAARRCRLLSGFAFPIWIGREPAGVLEFFSREPATPDAATLDALAQVGHQIGRVLERERATRDLHRREAHLAALLGSLVDVPMYVLDRDARIVEWIGGIDGARWGLRPEDALGKVPSEWFGVASYAPVLALVREAAATGEPRRIEQWFELPRGRFCFDIRLYPIPGTSGEAVRILAVNHDVTERRRAEDALRESERRYQTLAEAAPVGISRLDRQGQLVYRNRLMAEVSGFSAEEIARGAWLASIGPGETEEWRARIASLIESPEPRQLEYAVSRPDGSIRWALWRTAPEYDDAGQCTGFVSCVLDITERKAAEDARRESDRRYQTLAEAAPVGIVRLGTAGEVLYRNRRMEQLSGLPVEAMAGDGWLANYQPEDREIWKERRASLLANPGQRQDEYTMVRPDGSTAWVITTSVPEYDDAGQCTGFVSCVLDISERRLAEQALRESEHRFHSLAESLPVGVWRTDAAGRSVYENRRMAELLDLEPGSLIGLDSAERTGRHRVEGRVDPDAIDRIRDGFGAAVAAERPYAAEYRWRRRDGSDRWLHLRAEPELDASGAFVGHVGTVSDITDRKFAEQALRESRHRYQTLAEAMGVGVYRTDPLGRTVYANRRLWELIERDAIAIPSGDLALQLAEVRAEGRMDAAGIERAGRDMQAALEGRSPVTSELLWRARDGAQRWILLRAEPEFDADGAFLGLVTTATDVTELKRAEQELARHRDRLGELVAERTAELERSHEALRRSERLAAVGTFAAGIAHQINNPVGGILLAAQFAREDPGNRELVARALGDIAQDARHVGRIVRGVLEFARGPSRDPEPCDLNGAVGACTGQLSQDASERGVVLELELAERLPAVLGNASALEQVLTNLVWNAIEASARCVRVRTAAVDGGVELTVADDGEGIAAEDLDRVFDPLFTTRSRSGGTGLGLALAHGIVQAHAGRIAVASRRGEGTTITILLPRA